MEWLKILISLGTLIVLTVATIKGLREYRSSIKQKRLELYLKLRERFEEDDLIRDIIHLIEENSDKLHDLTKKEKFHYVGFFEDVAIIVKAKELNKNLAFYMFGYCAIKCYECDKFWEKNIEKKSDYWSVFKNFATDMVKIQNEQPEAYAL